MLRLAAGDIFTAEVEALVNPTNANNGGAPVPHGQMAALAGAFARKFQGLAEDYYAEVADGTKGPGWAYPWTNPHGTPHVINLPCVPAFGATTDIPTVELALQALAGEIARCGFKSVAVPALGTGVGGLAWDDLRDAVRRWHDSTEDLHGVDITLFEPFDASRRAGRVRQAGRHVDDI
jgi:O-acetyl-ADP-ribose deacetylase (regulator of RNase III)